MGYYEYHKFRATQVGRKPSFTTRMENFIDECEYILWDGDMVEKWLCSLGFQQYVENFSNKQISGADLMYLNEEELRDMGIYVIGHRKKLMRDITELVWGVDRVCKWIDSIGNQQYNNNKKKK